MKKVFFAVGIVLGLVGLSAARPGPGHRPHRPPPPPPPRVHYHAPRHNSFGWGVHLGPWGGALSIGTRIGRHGGISYTIPLYQPPPPPVRETIIVQQPAIVQQPIIVQSPAREVVVEQDAPKTRTWVEGHWEEQRDARGNLLSRTWVDGYWKLR